MNELVACSTNSHERFDSQQIRAAPVFVMYVERSVSACVDLTDRMLRQERFAQFVVLAQP